VPRRLFQVLHAAVGTIDPSSDDDAPLRNVLAAIRGMSGVDHGFLACLDAEAKRLRICAADGLFQEIDGRLHERGAGLIGQVWSTGQPVSIDDYASWSGRGIDLVAHGAATVAVVPVAIGTTVIGVLGVAHDSPGHPFDASDLEALEAAARVVALLLERDPESVRQRAQRAAREADEEIERRVLAREQRILDVIPVGVWVKDRDNRVLRANEAAARSLGLPRVAVEDRYLWEIDPSNAANAYRRDLEVFDREQSARDERVERIDARGERRWWSVDREVLRDEGGEAEGIVVVTRDVTEEHVNRGRVEASRRAELRARRVRDHAVANIAQNVRGPLRRVREGLADAPEVIHLITDLEVAMQWIDDLIDFERVEAGNVPVQCAPLDVGELVEDVVELVAPAAVTHGNELAVHVDPTIVSRLGGDAVRIRQILVQLLAQANRAVREGEILLAARTVMNGAARCEIRFEVHLSALTPLERDIEARFGPYLRGPSALDGDTDPGAVGLALAHRLVEVVGGSLGAEAGSDGGAIFWCALPLERVAVGGSGPVAILPRPGGRILLAVQSATVALVLERQLHDLGSAVDRASSLEEARVMIDAAAEDSWEYDLVLVDTFGGVGEIESWAQSLDMATRRRVTAMVPGFVPPERLRFGGDHPVLRKPVRRRRLLDLVLGRLGPDPRAETPPPRVKRPSLGTLRVLLVHDVVSERRLIASVLRELGCVVVESDVRSLEGEPLVGAFDLAVSFDAAPSCGASPVVDAVRRHDGSRDHTPVVLLSAALGAIEHDVALASGADGAESTPRDLATWEGFLARWARARGGLPA